MSWFKRHLNWTLVIAWLLLSLLACFVLSMIGWFGILAYLLMILVVSGWVLKQKGRSLTNLLWFLLFFCLGGYSHSLVNNTYAISVGEVAGWVIFAVVIILCKKNKRTVLNG